MTAYVSLAMIPAAGHAALVVAADPALQTLIGEALARLGLPVREAPSVGIAAAALDDASPLALLVVDLDGHGRPPWPAALALAARVWARSGAPAVFVAPWPEPELQALVERDGVGAVLYKPFRLAELEATVRSLLGG
jgi:DNA-binding response OmpR family regulator